MIKPLFKTVKVIHNAHLKQYEVWYKNFIFWHFDSCYKMSEYTNEEMTKTRAIDRAAAMLKTEEVWRQSRFMWKQL